MADAVENAAPDGPKLLSWGMLSRLSVLNFLQFAIWGAWYSVFGAFMLSQGFTDADVGWAYALLPLACIIGPFIGGQIADRWVPTQMFLAGAHLIGGIAMLLCASAFDQGRPVPPAPTESAVLATDATSQTSTPKEATAQETNASQPTTQMSDEERAALVVANKRHARTMLAWMLVWSLVYGPTLGLVNSLCFHHLPSGEKDFGKVRVWGTIAWILVGWALTFWLNVRDPSALPNVLSWATGLVSWLGTVFTAEPQNSDCLRFAGWLSIVMAVYCLTLPHTPPAKSGEKPWAFVEAFKLLKDWHFAVFMGISFLVSTELVFYFGLTSPFLVDVGIAEENVALVMTLAQVAEILTLSAVGWFLPKLGLRWSLAIGIIAWPLRYAIFASGGPAWLMVAALPLHGICFVCFFVVAFIYVDKVAPPDIRASAQSLLNFVLYGIGMFLGAKFSGWVKGYFTAADGVTNWTGVFLVPVVITTICAIAFFVSFKDPSEESEAA